jgi:hypothetical protein
VVQAEKSLASYRRRTTPWCSPPQRHVFCPCFRVRYAHPARSRIPRLRRTKPWPCHGGAAAVGWLDVCGTDSRRGLSSEESQAAHRAGERAFVTGHSPAPPATRGVLMASVIIPHFCSILRCLGRPRLLTRLAGLPTGRPRSAVPQMRSRNLLHIRCAIPMDGVVHTEDPVCTPIAHDTLSPIDQAAPPGGAVLC